MKHMTLREIAQACKGTYFGSEESMGKEVSSVVIDSRKVEKAVCSWRSAGRVWTDIHSFRRR